MIKRAAEHHLVMSAIHPKPKPVKQARKKNPRPVIGICPSCGEISKKTDFIHRHDCSGEIGVIYFGKKQTETQMIKAALDELMRQITIWRDGCLCVINTHECRGVSQWGHVYPQGANAHLVYELSNSFRQCAGHNLLHRSVQAPYFLWFQRTFGRHAFDMLEDERLAHPRCEYNVVDYRGMVDDLIELYSSRFSYGNSSMAEKIAAGFYGSIIREAWIKDGRI